MSASALIDADAVAEQLAMSPRWVLAEARSGRLSHYIIGRRVRFDPAAIAKWIDDHHHPATDDRRVSYPIAPVKPARHAGSRGRVPSVTPPAAMYPSNTRPR